MKLHLDTRMYTNVILTVIALLLLALCLNVYQVSVTPSACAQTGSKIDTTIPQTQDVAVARATEMVADANRDIADAIKQLSKSVETISGAVEKAQSGAPKQ